MQLSRRDDLESLAYMLINICKKDGLPWSKMDKVEDVLLCKESINERYLCLDIPSELATFLKYIKSLEFN